MNAHKTDALPALLKSLPELASEARDRAEEFETARHISVDFVEKLKALGAYRILVQRDQGGLGGTLSDWLHVMTTLAEADASTGWTCSHGEICSALLATTANPSFIQEFFAKPNNSAAWSNLPGVKSREVPGGLQITRRWFFVTGCISANYVGGMLPHPASPSDGLPHLVVALVKAEDARIDETWDPIGLVGSGSHEVVFDDAFVPHEQIFDWPISKINTALATSVYASGTWFISLCAAATHLGLARRALDEARISLKGKLDRGSQTPLLEQQSVLETLEEAEGLLFACRSAMEMICIEVQICIQNHAETDGDLQSRARLACYTAVHQGAHIVRSANRVAGAGAVLKTGVMQRLLRDASCLIHHVSVNRKSLELVGRYRIGVDPISQII